LRHVCDRTAGTFDGPRVGASAAACSAGAAWRRTPGRLFVGVAVAERAMARGRSECGGTPGDEGVEESWLALSPARAPAHAVRQPRIAAAFW